MNLSRAEAHGSHPVPHRGQLTERRGDVPSERHESHLRPRRSDHGLASGPRATALHPQEVRRHGRTVGARARGGEPLPPRRRGEASLTPSPNPHSSIGLEELTSRPLHPPDGQVAATGGQEYPSSGPAPRAEMATVARPDPSSAYRAERGAQPEQAEPYRAEGVDGPSP